MGRLWLRRTDAPTCSFMMFDEQNDRSCVDGTWHVMFLIFLAIYLTHCEKLFRLDGMTCE